MKYGICPRILRPAEPVVRFLDQEPERSGSIRWTAAQIAATNAAYTRALRAIGSAKDHIVAVAAGHLDRNGALAGGITGEHMVELVAMVRARVERHIPGFFTGSPKAVEEHWRTLLEVFRRLDALPGATVTNYLYRSLPGAAPSAPAQYKDFSRYTIRMACSFFAKDYTPTAQARVLIHELTHALMGSSDMIRLPGDLRDKIVNDYKVRYTVAARVYEGGTVYTLEGGASDVTIGSHSLSSTTSALARIEVNSFLEHADTLANLLMEWDDG